MRNSPAFTEKTQNRTNINKKTINYNLKNVFSPYPEIDLLPEILLLPEKLNQFTSPKNNFEFVNDY